MKPRHLFWIPPFLVGATAAAAAELSAGLLLYSTEGLLRALTVVLATETAALGVGLASSAHLGPGDLAPVRRRWMLALVAFGGAAAFSAAWGLGEGFSAAPLAQGLGLALLGGFPLYASGAVLGALGSAATSGTGTGAGTGAAAAFGAGTGVLLTGLLAVPGLEPTSVYLFCVVGVSVGALVHGWLLDRRILVRVLDDLPGSDPADPVRLEERFRPVSEQRVRVVTVRGRIADGAGEDDGLVVPWQRGVVELLRRRSDGIDRAVLVGVGLEAFPAALRSVLGELVTETPWRELRTMAVRAERTDGDREEVRRGTVHSRFDAVVVNLRLLPGASLLGPAMPVLERAARRRSEGGVLALGGLELDGASPGTTAGLLRWISDRRWAPTVSILRPERAGRDAATRLLGNGPDRGGALLLGGSSGAGTGLLEIPGMRPVPEEEGRVPPGPDTAGER